MDLFHYVKARLSILDVVGEYVALKRAGTYYKGNCPIHAERTPSFTVSPHRGIYYCFGCSKGGDAIAFISEVERCSAREAALSLAERFHIEIPRELLSQATHSTTHSERERYFTACKAFTAWCTKNLAHHDRARAYLHERGMSERTISRFSLGYCPSGERAIQAFLGFCREQNILAHDLVEAHILREGPHGLFCVFEERIVFPIENNLGAVCGFGGRVFEKNDTRPKYVNSHDHPLFSKSTVLYGLAQNKKSIHHARTAHLVEGYFDCILLSEAGIQTAVATLGTACTTQHLEQLARHAEKIIVTYDGDAAGYGAIMRLARLCWQIESELRVALLPTGEDPASLIAQKKDILPFLEKNQSIWHFAIHETANTPTESLHERLTGIRELLENIRKLNDPLKEQMLILEASKALGIPPEELAGSAKQAPPTQKTPSIASKTIQSEITDFEKDLLYGIIVGWGTFPDDVIQSIFSTSSARVREIMTLYQEWRSAHVDEHLDDFLEQLTPERKLVLSGVLMRGEALGLSADESINEFLKKQWKLMVKRVKMNFTQTKSQPNQPTHRDLLITFETLRRVMHRRGLI
jgi:DNA primase